MQPTRAERAFELFEELIQLPEPRRFEILENRCGADADLRDRVLAMLKAAGQMETTGAASSPDTVVGSARLDRTIEPRQEIGPYTIREIIGRGGMGVVCLAEQRTPVRRTVALKLIKKGMDSEQVIGRFEAERQALAMMDHPNVAKVFDAGATDDGRPYFVMEYVRGEPITDYCDRHRLSTPRRLSLVMQCCEAVQHAHQKGIIHRDLKPANVLVTVVEDHPLVKVIDFGVAKAVSQPLTEHTVFTELGQIIGTPEYMSPEQAEMTGLNVDTRTDVYSLGVLLYELLTGSIPFEPQELRRGGIDEIRRRIREEDPPKPSTRLSGLNKEDSGTIAKGRSTTVGNMVRQLRGDLDWITMKAMDKDRIRRYQSASEMAADIQRHLDNEAVVAGPPSAVYRFRKYVRRNKGLVAALAAILLALGSGVVATTSALAEARHQATIADAVGEFLVETLNKANPAEEGPNVTVAQVIRDGGASIDERFAESPEIRFTLHETYGDILRTLNDHEASERHFETALAIARKHEPPSTVARLLNKLGITLLDRGHDAAAARMFDEAMEIAAAAGAEERVEALLSRGFSWHNLGDYDLAEDAFRRALKPHPDLVIPEEQAARARDMLGRLLIDRGDVVHAAPLVLEALEIKKRLFGARHVQIAFSYLTVGYLERARGDYAASQLAFETARRMYAELHAGDAPVVMLATIELAALLEDTGQQAPEWSIEGLESLKSMWAIIARNRARLLHRRGRVDDAHGWFRVAVEADSGSGAPSRRPSEAHTRRIWAEALLQDGRIEDARREFRTALDIQRSVLHESDRQAVVPTLLGLAGLSLAEDEPESALVLLEEALELRNKRCPPDSLSFAAVHSELGRCMASLGRVELARSHLQLAANVLEAVRGVEDDRAIAARSELERAIAQD